MIKVVFYLGRANTIARTEATRVVNQATSASYQTLSENGIQVKKQWLSSQDALVRKTHEALDGVIVGANENFQLPSQFRYCFFSCFFSWQVRT